MTTKKDIIQTANKDEVVPNKTNTIKEYTQRELKLRTIKTIIATSIPFVGLILSVIPIGLSYADSQRSIGETLGKNEMYQELKKLEDLNSIKEKKIESLTQENVDNNILLDKLTLELVEKDRKTDNINTLKKESQKIKEIQEIIENGEKITKNELTKIDITDIENWINEIRLFFIKYNINNSFEEIKNVQNSNFEVYNRKNLIKEVMYIFIVNCFK